MPARLNPSRAAVSTGYLRLLFEYLAREGVDASALLGETEPTLEQLDGRYPMDRWRTLLQRAAQHLDDPLLGLKLGRTITPSHLGLLGYLILACGTLGAALQRYERYERLFYDANALRTAIDRDGVVLEWGMELGAPGALADECALASLVQIARDITGQALRVESLQFVNPAPSRREAYDAYFGCAVVFDGEVTRLRLNLSTLALPLRSPDPGLLRVIEQQAELQLRKLGKVGTFEMEVRTLLARLMREGTPDIDHVARALNTSTRTLHRRLAEEGWNFKQLLNDTRHRLAEDYLANPRLQLSEIALLLGYSEQSAFTRAFGKWTGTTPMQARRAIKARPA